MIAEQEGNCAATASPAADAQTAAVGTPPSAVATAGGAAHDSEGAQQDEHPPGEKIFVMN